MKAVFTRVGEYIGRSSLRQLGYSAVTAAFISLIAKGFGFVKEIVIAAHFGLSGGLDVYLMALILIGFPLSILLNAIQSILISIFASGEHSANGEGRLYTSTVTLTLIVLATVLPLWLVLLHYTLPWFASGFSIEKLQWLESAIYWLIPYYFFNGISLLGYGVLQAKKRFVTNGLLPIITSVAIIIIVLIFNQSNSWQVLVTALVVGAAIECIVVNIIIYKSSGFVRPVLFENVELKKLVKSSLVLLSGTFLAAISPLVGQSIAASLGDGTNAALGYGFRLPAALIGIIVTAIGITALPYFSALLAEGRMSYSLHSLEKLSRWLLILGLPFAAMLAFLSEPITSLLFQRGAFDVASVSRVSPIQQAYFMQLPFLLIVILCTKMLVALNKHGVVSFLSAIVVFIQVSLVWWLGTTHGAAGIAWGVTIATALASVVYFLLSRNILQKKIV